MRRTLMQAKRRHRRIHTPAPAPSRRRAERNDILAGIAGAIAAIDSCTVRHA